MDVALFVSLAMAIPAALLSDVMVVHVATAWEQHGRLGRGEGSRLDSILIEKDRASAPWDHARPYGTFVLHVPQQQGGLPFVSSRRSLPMRVEVDLFSEPDVEWLSELSAEHPVRAAIDEAVRQRGGFALELWEGAMVPSTRSWGVMAVNAICWWIALHIASSVVIALLRAGAFVMQQRRTVYQRQMRLLGKCAACGYDLRGLEFSERCPECGELA